MGSLKSVLDVWTKILFRTQGKKIVMVPLARTDLKESLMKLRSKKKSFVLTLLVPVKEPSASVIKLLQMTWVSLRYKTLFFISLSLVMLQNFITYFLISVQMEYYASSAMGWFQ